MCPACFAATAWVVAGTTSAGGLTVFIASKLKGRKRRRAEITTPSAAEPLPVPEWVHDERKRP